MVTRPDRPLRGNRDFVLLWTAGVASSLGSQLTLVAYPLLALVLSGSAARAGLLGSVGLLTRTLLRLPAGALVDRWDRRLIMLWCDAVRAVVLAGVVVSVLAGMVTFWVLLVASAAESVFTVLFVPAERAALRSVVPVTALTPALAANEARQHAAELAGPPLGGLLFGLGRALPFLGDAVSYLYSFVAVLLIRTPLRVEARTSDRRGLVREIADGLALTWRQPLLRAIALCVAGSNVVYTALIFGVIVVAQQGGASATSIGAMLGATGVGGLLGAFAAPRLIALFAPVTVLLGVLWAGAVALPAMAIDLRPALIGPLLAFFTFLMPAANTILVSTQMAITPPDTQGRVFSSVLFLSGLGAAGAPVLTGLLLEAVAGRTAVLVLATAMVLVAVLATTSRSLRSLGEPQVASA